MPKVPGEVYAAVTTNRIEFMTLLEGRVKAGQFPTTEEILGMVQLVREEIEQRAKDRETLNLLRKSVQKLYDAGKGIMKAGLELQIVLDKIDRGESITAEELKLASVVDTREE